MTRRTTLAWRGQDGGGGGSWAMKGTGGGNMTMMTMMKIPLLLLVLWAAARMILLVDSIHPFLFFPGPDDASPELRSGPADRPYHSPRLFSGASMAASMTASSSSSTGAQDPPVPAPSCPNWIVVWWYSYRNHSPAPASSRRRRRRRLLLLLEPLLSEMWEQVAPKEWCLLLLADGQQNVSEGRAAAAAAAAGEEYLHDDLLSPPVTTTGSSTTGEEEHQVDRSRLDSDEMLQLTMMNIRQQYEKMTAKKADEITNDPQPAVSGNVQQRGRVHFLSLLDPVSNNSSITATATTTKFIQQLRHKHLFNHPQPRASAAADSAALQNWGYLYAIQHGAQRWIWDMDMLDFLRHLQLRLPNKPVEPHNNSNTGGLSDPAPTSRAPWSPVLDDLLSCSNRSCRVRVPLLGGSLQMRDPCSSNRLYERGNESSTLNSDLHNGSSFISSSSSLFTLYWQPLINMNDVGVIQFCPDHYYAERQQAVTLPDAKHNDSAYLPVVGRSTERESWQDERGGIMIALPPHAWAPYPASGMVHAASAFWALLWPLSVPASVSVEWRSYLAQTIFRSLDLKVFVAPSNQLPPGSSNTTTNSRNQSDLSYYANDTFASRTDELLAFLKEWNNPGPTVPATMESLWIDLYERGFVEFEDVDLMQLWLKALVEIGYLFPPIQRKRIDNVVLMGQFNYAVALDSALLWVQKWQQVFSKVVMRGPFNETDISILRSMGIEVYYGRNDRGYFSPMENLRDTLLTYKGVQGYDGVLYIHDDALLNVTEVLRLCNGSFPNDTIIANRMPRARQWYEDPRDFLNETSLLLQFTFSISSRKGQYYDGTGMKLSSSEELLKDRLQHWMHWPGCIRSLRPLAKDPRTGPYLTSRRPGHLRSPWPPFITRPSHFLVPSYTQADFLYVPLRWADAFAQAATLMLDHKVFLECGFPTIIQMMRETVPDLALQVLWLCTVFDANRGTETMMQNCLHSLRNVPNRSFGVYHPFKISTLGPEFWSSLFDRIVLNLS